MEQRKIGAVYCVYEDSGFLEESVRRIYHLMDKIIFLVGSKPWNGSPNFETAKDTYLKTVKMFDPLNKIEIISKSWAKEHDQRNYGLDHLYKQGIDWCFIIDDDEMYNYADLKRYLQEVLSSEFLVFQCPHQIYWKDTNLVILEIQPPMPAFVRTDTRIAWFDDARNITCKGNWAWFEVNQLLCHHYSFVRSDEQMWRKITHFSHAHPTLTPWYNNIWKKWNFDMRDLHPNFANPKAFSRAIPKMHSPYILESSPINIFGNLEKIISQIQEESNITLPEWLKGNPISDKLLDFWFKFIKVICPKQILEYGTTSGYSYFTFCEAISQNSLNSKITSISETKLGPLNQKYDTFSNWLDVYLPVSFEDVEVIHFAGSRESFILNDLSVINKKLFILISGTNSFNKDFFFKLKQKNAFYEFTELGFGVIEICDTSSITL